MVWPAYADVNVPRQLVEALINRQMTILRAQEDQADQLDDVALLERAYRLKRALITQDTDFFQIRDEWLNQAREFVGIIILKHEPTATFTQFVDDIVLILETEESLNWLYVVPFPVAPPTEPTQESFP